ncbi:MAG: 4Fe-4S dicluster domain-containing protein [Armatimonadota bacterium]
MAQTQTDDRIVLSGDNNFRDKISKQSGQDIIACYQCGECTAGCPVAYKADISPNQISRLVQLGQEKAALESSMIWLCVGCETCATRCPRGIELSKVMDTLRENAIESGCAVGEQNIKTFHDTFLSSVQRGGRIHEISMLGEYKLRTLDLFTDIFMGMKMFCKGKLAIEPSVIKDRKNLKRIFKKAKKK